VIVERLTVMQGETRVCDDPQVMLTTVLGSCIAACLYDPERKLGGLNHFLLPEPGHDGTNPRELQRYGSYAMDYLVTAMLERGGVRKRLRARLFGGASLHRTFRDIGASNAAFARRFLREADIALVGEDVGGSEARRVEFQPTMGLCRCRSLTVPPPGNPELFR